MKSNRGNSKWILLKCNRMTNHEGTLSGLHHILCHSILFHTRSVHGQLARWRRWRARVSTGVSKTSEFRYSHRNNEGDSGQVTSQPWNRASPSNPATRKYSWNGHRISCQNSSCLWYYSKHIMDICQSAAESCYADVMFALRLVAVNLSNCSKMQNGTLTVSMYCSCRETVTNVNKNRQ